MAVLKKFCPTVKLHIYQDLTKNWFITFRDSKGKRHKKQGKVNHAQTYDERIKALNALKKYYEDNFTILDDVLGDIEKWLQDNQGKWREKTYQTYWSKVTVFNDWLSGRVVDNEAVRDFFRWMLANRESGTYMDYRQEYTRLFREVGRPELMDGVPAVKFCHTPARYFQDRQVNQLRKTVIEKSPELWFFIQCMTNCFVRPKEARLLISSDFLLDDGLLIVRKGIAKNGTERRVPILPNFLATVRTEIAALSPNEYVFESCFNGRSEPIGENTMYNRFRAVLKQLNYPKGYTLYSWRHTGAVKAKKDDMSTDALCKMMGHYSIQQTEQYLRQLGVMDYLDDIHKYKGI